MDDTDSARRTTLVEREPWAVRLTSDYVKRLLLERHHIYAKLYNPGGSIILTASGIIDADRDVDYSSQIGSSFHLDLIDLEQRLQRLIDEKVCTKKEMEAVLTWLDGMNAVQAASYLNVRKPATIRKRRERGLKKISEALIDDTERIGGTSDGDASRIRQEAGHDAIQDGDSG